MQTQQRVWNSFQQYNVVSFVVSTCIAIVFGFGLVGATSRTEVQVAHAQTSATCAKNDRTHVVVGGDKLASIAAYYGLSERKVVEYNHIADPNSIYINRSICIPNMASVQRLNAFHSYKLPTKAKAPVAVMKSADKVKVEQRERPAAEDNYQEVPVNDALARVPPGYAAPQPMSVAQGFKNVYAFGQCTWWAAQRYFQLHGEHVPWTHNANAGQWVDRAREFGWRVSSVPTVGAIFVLQPDVQGASTVGHVGVVEQILNDGSVIASSMNWGAPSGMIVNHPLALGSGVDFITR